MFCPVYQKANPSCLAANCTVEGDNKSHRDTGDAEVTSHTNQSKRKKKCTAISSFISRSKCATASSSPAQRPSEPAQQPPSLLLPASPPVFDPLEGTLKIDKAPTRCLSSYSSAFSCPSFKGRYIPSTSSASSSLKSKTSQYLDEEIKSASLSPTIFSFLREQGGSSSASVSTEGRTEYTQRHVGVCDDIAEQLQFDMQMDTLQDEDESKASQIPPGMT